MDIKIIVATHKKYKMPLDEIYIPIHVGKKDKNELGYIGDDTAENISNKNMNYCELTGLYWAWKNLKCEYLGLAHYRRNFCVEKSKDKFGSIAKKSQLQAKLENVDIILPKKRNYYIETIYSHYSHTFHKIDLDITEDIIAEKYPNYLSAYHCVMNRKQAHIYNMFIMKKALSDKYCEWLFDILFELERRLDISNYSPFEARVFGRVSERLLDVWIITNKLSFVEVPVIYLEKINWPKKIVWFLKAKFLGIKYKRSF